MPTVIGAAFTEFLGRLELNPTRVELASVRYGHVKRILEQSLPGASIRRIGSFRRNTKIRPRDLGDGLDLDVLVQLYSVREYASQGEGVDSAQTLVRVYQAVRTSETFRAMEPRKDAPVVVLEYADEFQIELVPGIEDTSGRRSHPGGSNACWVPRPGGGWMFADYDFDADYISALNQSKDVSGALVPTIKLLKAFARSRNLPLKSFHIELIAALALPARARQWNAAGRTWDLQHAFSAVLEDARIHMTGPISLPGSHSPPVDSGLGPELQDVAEYLAEAGAAAWRLCMDPSNESALNGWGRLLGAPFPATSNFL